MRPRLAHLAPSLVHMGLREVVIPALLAAAAAAQGACPCADPSLCAPLNLPPRPEIVGFSVNASNWQCARAMRVCVSCMGRPFDVCVARMRHVAERRYYRLGLLTTVINFAGRLDPTILCLAHGASVKLLSNAPYPAAQLHNESFLAGFIATQVASVRDSFFDGINFDFEDPLDASGGDAAALTRVIAATAAALRAQIAPYVTVAVDVAWSPNCIDLRCYDYAGMAAAADLVFVMAYDMRSQVWWAVQSRHLVAWLTPIKYIFCLCVCWHWPAHVLAHV